MKKAILLFLLLPGCFSIAEINDRARQIDRLWTLDYQRGEDELRYRVVEAPAPMVYQEVRRAIIDLGLPVISESEDLGELTAQNNAPAPLTQEEWLEVRKIEEPRMREVAGWMFVWKDDASEYIVTIKAIVKGKENISVVHLEYNLDYPKYRRLGIIMPTRAPATAVRIATQKFWTLLQARLEKLKIAAPRRRKATEFEI